LLAVTVVVAGCDSRTARAAAYGNYSMHPHALLCEHDIMTRGQC